MPQADHLHASDAVIRVSSQVLSVNEHTIQKLTFMYRKKMFLYILQNIF